MASVRLSELVFDQDLYPRGGIVGVHLSMMKAAYASGAQFPPIIACRRTKRIVDGVHRWKVYTEAGIEKVSVMWQDYATDEAFFLDAMRHNVTHGHNLTPADRVRCAIICLEKFGVAIKDAARSLGMPIEMLQAIAERRTATDMDGKGIALKRTVQHMHGRTLTPVQIATNTTLTGLNQATYANQLIALYEADMLDTTSEQLRHSLTKLLKILPAALAKFEVAV